MPLCRNLILGGRACGREKGRLSLFPPIMSAKNHVRSSSCQGLLGVKSIAEFGVGARTDNSLFGKVGYVSLQSPLFRGLINILKLRCTPLFLPSLL